MQQPVSCVTRNLGHHVNLQASDIALLKSLEKDPRKVDKGKVLWEAHETPTQLYTLRSGWAYAFHCSENGAQQVLDIFLPGDVMGIRDATSRTHYTTAVMLTDGVICPFPTVRLEDLFTQSPRLALGLYASASRQQSVITERLVNVLSNDACSRLGHFALEIYYRLKRIEETTGNSFTLPLTQRQLAMLLGMSEVHVSRTMSDLAERGLITRRRQSFQINDLDTLSQISDFRPEKFSDRINPCLAHLFE